LNKQICFLAVYSRIFYFSQILPNFYQNNVNETTNLLDYIITESECRIFSIDHQPPLGNIEHGHHIKTFNFSYLKTNTEDRDLGEMFLYQKGKYDQFENFLNETNWIKEFINLNADECYKKWLDIYNEGCSRFIPKIRKIHYRAKTLWITKDLKQLIRKKKTTWYKCRNSKFIKEELAKEYKTLNKQVKIEVKQAITKFERELASKSRSNPKMIQ
jgi:hypothetical protein